MIGSFSNLNMQINLHELVGFCFVACILQGRGEAELLRRVPATGSLSVAEPHTTS